MPRPRTPGQRVQFLVSARSELDISPILARRLLELSEAARRHSADPSWLHRSRGLWLLDELGDDALCEHARLVAADEGEQLWRELLARSKPPDDVGPALLLAVSLDARCAADEAYDVLRPVVRPGECRRWAFDLAMDLTEDGGDPRLALDALDRLGVDRDRPRYSALHCLVHCAPHGDCPSMRLAGAARARWLWGRAKRWVRLPWADMQIGAEADHLLIAEGGALADVVREFAALRGPGPMSRGLFGYLRARWARLPSAERDLLLRWIRVRWRRFTVLDATPYELVLADEAGDQAVAAAAEETPADRTWASGDIVSGWLLPTAVPAEHFFVVNNTPAAWFR